MGVRVTMIGYNELYGMGAAFPHRGSGVTFIAGDERKSRNLLYVGGCRF